MRPHAPSRTSSTADCHNEQQNVTQFQTRSAKTKHVGFSPQRVIWGLGGVIITDRLCVVSSAHTTQTSSYLYLFFGEHLLQSVHNDQAVGALNGGRALTETQKNKTDLFLP